MAEDRTYQSETIAKLPSLCIFPYTHKLCVYIELLCRDGLIEDLIAKCA